MKFKKTIAAAAVVAVVLSVASVLAFAEEHKHTYGEWTKTETTHSRTCTGMIIGEDETETPCDHEETGDHTYGDTVTAGTNGTHTKTCETCGYVKTEDCTAGASAVEDGKHVKKCNKCGQVLESKDHTAKSEWSSDDNQHWKVCAEEGCSEIVGTKADHTWADKSNASGHYKECTVCKKTTTPTAHAAADGAAWLDDGTSHYKTCSVAGCSAKVNSAAHSAGGSTKKDAINHWNECTCGKVMNKTAHTGVAKKSATQHWEECSCGWVTVAAASHDTAGDDGACSVCGYKDGDTANDSYTENGEADVPSEPHQHAAAETYSSDENNHWKACTADNCTTGGKVDVAAHTWGTGDNANKCTVCDYVKTTASTPDPEETTPPADDDVTPPADNDVTPPTDDDVTPPADDDTTPPADDNNNNNDNAVVDDNATAGVTGASSSAEADAVTVSTPAQVAATRNPVLTVNAAETPVSSDMLGAFVKNNDAKTLTLSYSSALKVVIDKDDVSDASVDLDFSVSKTSFLSAKEIKKLGADQIVQIDFAGEGKLEGVDKVTVKYRVGAKLAGKEVTVYEYKDGKLVKIGTGKVTINGFVNFKTDHFGKFVIAVE